MNREKQRNSNNVLIRIIKKAFLALVILGIPAVLFLYSFHIKNIEVVGTDRYTQEQMKELIFQNEADFNALYLYLKYRFFEKPKFPFIEKIDVDMVDNHSVTIFVYEKMVAGCVEFMGEYLYFDKDGIVVESTTNKLDGVPVIKGLKFNEIVLNEKLKVQKDSVLTKESQENEAQSSNTTQTGDGTQKSDNTKDSKKKQEAVVQAKDGQADEETNSKIFDRIINLTQQIGKYELKVDIITFNSSNEVILDCEDVTVLLGERDSYDEPLSQLTNILKEAEGMSITLDMRNYVKGTDSFIAKPKKRQNR